LEYHTEKEENKEEFLKLDTEESKKQFILLVGKVQKDGMSVL
jgi:hypothetical protein